MKSLRTFVATSDLSDTKKVLSEIQKFCTEVQQAIAELQEINTAAVETDDDGFPLDKARCFSVNGQFLRLTQESAAPSILIIEHSLGRVPVGAIFISTTGVNKIFVSGDITQNISPATDTEVSFELNGSISEEHICLLI